MNGVHGPLWPDPGADGQAPLAGACAGGGGCGVCGKVPGEVTRR